MSALDNPAQEQGLNLLGNYDKIKLRTRFHCTLIKDMIAKGKHAPN